MRYRCGTCGATKEIGVRTPGKPLIHACPTEGHWAAEGDPRWLEDLTTGMMRLEAQYTPDEVILDRVEDRFTEQVAFRGSHVYAPSTALVRVSKELLEDGGVDVNSFVRRALARRIFPWRFPDRPQVRIEVLPWLGRLEAAWRRWRR